MQQQRTSDRATERPSDRATERQSDRATERPNERPFSNMIYSNLHMLPTVCTSMLNADGQLHVYILYVFLLTMPG